MKSLIHELELIDNRNIGVDIDNGNYYQWYEEVSLVDSSDSLHSVLSITKE